jgi:carboxyl-terminal processing protease
MNVPFDYSIDESFNTDYDKAPYAKIQLNLLKDGESRLNCRHFPLGAFEVQENKKTVLKAKAKKYTRCFSE